MHASNARLSRPGSTPGTRAMPRPRPPPAAGRRPRTPSAARPCARRRRRPWTPPIRAATANDADYVFITFILDHLPHGLIGLLVAAFFAAALSSKAAELNALGSTTTVDFYRHLVRREADDAHYVVASKWFTVLWGWSRSLRPLRPPGART